jgi:hypothetical protein
MAAKTWWALGILGLAAFSPAPINSGIPSPRIPEMSQEQLTKQQQFCGSLPVVGTVPAVQREGGLSGGIVKRDGDSPKVEGADTAILNGSRRADHVGTNASKLNDPLISNVTLLNATQVVEFNERKQKAMPLMIVLMLSIGYGAILVARKWVDKKIPYPKKVAAAR